MLVVVIAVLSMDMRLLLSFFFLLRLLSFLIVISHSLHSSKAAHAWHSTHSWHSAHSWHSSHSWHTSEVYFKSIGTLHLAGIESAKSLISGLFFFIFVDPLGPINLDVLVFFFSLQQSWPKSIFLFCDDEQQMEASFIPFGLLFINFLKELEIELVFLALAFSFECECSICQLNLLLIDVLQLNLDENSIFSLSPFSERVTKIRNVFYSIFVEGQSYYKLKLAQISIRLIIQNITYSRMDDPSENIEDQEIEEAEAPAENEEENHDANSEDEDDYPEFANDQNKKLNQLVRQKKRIIRKVNKEHDRDFQRKKILEEHLRNVEQQLLHTKGLIDVKNKETQTQNHMWQVTQRQSGRLESQVKKFNKVILENEERLNDIQVRIFRVNEKVEQIKLELNWNQQQLEQWAITGKQKEEDNVTLQKYRKEDDTKIRELNLQIQKLTIQVGRKQQQLQKQITATQASQIQLDKTAEQFRKQHDQRHKLFQKWQEVTKTIARRDEDINQIGEDFEALMESINQNKQILDDRKKQLDNQKRMNKEEEAKNVLSNREISDKKNQNKKMEFQNIANLKAEVQILKNQLSSFSTDLANKRNAVNFKNQDLLQKKQRLQTEEAKFNAHSIKLKNELKLAEKFDAAKINAQQNFKEKEGERKKIEQAITLQKDILVKNTQQLFKLREQEASLYGEIQGIMAAVRNLQSHVNKLNQEFQKQQQLLYNAQYQIQLMERKVARAKGQRTLQEKKDLQKDIDQASKKNALVKNQFKILNESVKKLNEDLRAVDNKLGDVKGSQKKFLSQIQELSLQNDMTIQDLSKITKKKEQVLVQHDIMKLEIKKIKQNLNKATDHVYGLQNKKNQLEMTMQEREKEIQVHRDVLLAEHKAIEDERHNIAIELAERKNKVKNLKIKYESLVQKAHGTEEGGQAEHSQAYYVIKASQERQELQRKGDQLSAKIIKAQKQLKSLHNTQIALMNRNFKLRDKLANKGVTKADLAKKDALQEQCNAASQNLFKKKNELKKLDQQYEQDMKRLAETQNKQESLKQRKGKLQQVVAALDNELNQNQQKMLRAQKSLNTVQTSLARKKIQISQESPHVAQLEFDIETDKNKTLVSTLINLGNDLPQLGPLIEDFLKENNVQIQSKAPSSIDLQSERGSVSVQSGGSAISRASRASRK